MIGQLRGRFVVLDGPDGSGKSTQAKRLAQELRNAGADLVTCRDPGGTEIGERIRSVLLDHDLSAMDVRCETLLFMASRAQLVGQVIQPALTAGKTVLADRYVSSTCAYQGAAGLDPRKIIQLAPFAIGETWPDLTIVIDVDPELGMRRIDQMPKNRGLPDKTRHDAMEQRSIEFHRRVHGSYRRLAEYYPRPVVLVDGEASEDVVFERIISALGQHLRA